MQQSPLHRNQIQYTVSPYQTDPRYQQFQHGYSGVPAKIQAGFRKVPGQFQQISNKALSRKVAARFREPSRAVPVFRRVHFRVTTARPQRLKPRRFAVGKEYNIYIYICIYTVKYSKISHPKCRMYNVYIYIYMLYIYAIYIYMLYIYILY